MAKSAQPEPCQEFRHWDGKLMRCRRDKGHRGSHHADSGLAWSRNLTARRARMTDGPCPDCQPVADDETRPARVRR